MSSTQTTDDPDLELRKARAERFGIPLVEKPQPGSTTSQAADITARAAAVGEVKFGHTHYIVNLSLKMLFEGPREAEGPRSSLRSYHSAQAADVV